MGEKPRMGVKMSDSKLKDYNSLGQRESLPMAGSLRAQGRQESLIQEGGGLAQGKVLNIENGPKTVLMDIQNS